MATNPTSRTKVLATFPTNLNLPEGCPEFAENAAEAVRQEYRSSVQWKRLRCRKLRPLTAEPGETIFVLEVGHSIEFDWTWEGAIAFRPKDPHAFTGDAGGTDDSADPLPGDGTINGGPGLWAGEVVEVDQTDGRLFVSVSDPDHPPCCGTFFVRPFEFLAFLHAILCQPGDPNLRKLLPARLHAARGGVHPRIPQPPGSGLKELAQLWRHSWGILWGPPGCGKTTTLGRQVAACLGDPAERILVLSTTNKATDAAALAIGRPALAALPHSIEEGRVLRIGKGADYGIYETSGLAGLLRGTETGLLQRIGLLTRDLDRAATHDERAVLRKQIRELRRSMKDSAFNVFVSPDVRVVVATAFKAITLLGDPDIREVVAAGKSPFTTVVIDEAGLMSRAVVATLSLLAARRVVVVGDAMQLAPLSKISRILPTSQAVWLASSSLGHLQSVLQADHEPGVHLLREQHRMHPDVSRAVSHFQYEGALRDAPGVQSRPTTLPPLLAECPRAAWYVLDEDCDDLPSIRAERGPGNRSWVRPGTRPVLAKFFADPEVRRSAGLFVTPFKAQACDIAAYFAEEGLGGWSAGTVHGRQGTEADVVIFDTVNAGSCGWPHDEWKRLVNVGLSRAREFVLLLASRAEMSEPYLRPLLETLAPRILKRSGRGLSWAEVPARLRFTAQPDLASDPDLLGSQIARRKALRPVMSAEQQRLCGLSMDGKPRLVRGVAGSGKTVVLAHWFHKTVQRLADRPDAKAWAVYANRSLHRLLFDTIDEAQQSAEGAGPFPWGRVELLHVKDILDLLFKEAGERIRWDDSDYNYDRMAASYLARRPPEKIKPHCHAMFIDEAQDMGPNTLKLLSALVEQSEPDNPKSRAVNIFYDNAQNIYGRSTPRWSEMGLDMRGRSTVMKESFRSTRPITEFALNLLYRLQPPDSDPDHKELVERGLIEKTQRRSGPWWAVRFNQVDGPPPVFKKYPLLGQQIEAIGDQVIRWMRHEGVSPGDISIVYNQKFVKDRLEERVAPRLRQVGARLAVHEGLGERRSPEAVVASTLHSFKGYDSEIVVVAGLEQFVVRGQGILAHNLYVAMTRARSILSVYAATKQDASPEAARLLSTVEDCLSMVLERPAVERETSHADEFEGVLERVGPGCRDWLAKLWASYLIQQEPLLAPDGEILAEPLFWFQVDDKVVACFGGEDPGTSTLHKVEDAGISVIRPGQEPPAATKT